MSVPVQAAMAEFKQLYGIRRTPTTKSRETGRTEFSRYRRQRRRCPRTLKLRRSRQSPERSETNAASVLLLSGRNPAHRKERATILPKPQTKARGGRQSVPALWARYVQRSTDSSTHYRGWPIQPAERGGTGDSDTRRAKARWTRYGSSGTTNLPTAA